MAYRSRVSFRQIRRTADAVSQLSTGGSEDEGLSRGGLLGETFIEDLTHEYVSDDRRAPKLEVCLALLEWERLASGSLVGDKIELLFDVAAGEIAHNQGGFGDLVQVINQEYTQSEFLGLVDWIIRRLGAQSSKALEGLVHRSSRKQAPRIERSIISPTLLLSSLSRLASLPASYFQVTALDAYIRRYLASNTSAVLDDILAFGDILSLETRQIVLQHSLELRRAQLRLEDILAPLSSEHGREYEDNTNDDGFMRYSGIVKGRKTLVVRRSDLLSESMQLLSPRHNHSLANGVEIIFEEEYGKDGGGLLKEWLRLLLEELLPRSMQLADTSATQFNIHSSCIKSEAELLGVVIGLALLHSVPIGLQLPSHIYPFLQEKDQGVDLSLDDLAEVRPGLAQGLKDMLGWPEEGFTDSLSMTFCHTADDGTSVPLIEGGDAIPVTYDTRHLYVERICEFVLIEERIEQLYALRDGFRRVWEQVDGIRLFSSKEMTELISGREIDLDAASLRKLCPVDMVGPGDKDYMDAFWDILQAAETSTTPTVMKKLLIFVTASHRLPLVLQNQQQQEGQRRTIAFKIVLLGDDKFASCLPFASTCGNVLFLPRYPSLDILRSRLLIALEYGCVGFGRS